MKLNVLTCFLLRVTFTLFFFGQQTVYCNSKLVIPILKLSTHTLMVALFIAYIYFLLYFIYIYSFHSRFYYVYVIYLL